jgi:hypothetical protein
MVLVCFRVASDSDGSVLIEPTDDGGQKRGERQNPLFFRLNSIRQNKNSVVYGSDGKFTIIASGSGKEFYLATIHIHAC